MDDYGTLWQLLILGITVYGAYKIGEVEGMVQGYKEGIEENKDNALNDQQNPDYKAGNK